MQVYKPTTPARRGTSVIKDKRLSRKKPEKSLTRGKKSSSGRSEGKITVRHKGGGAKRSYRQIDFRQDKFDIPARVEAIEYDPNRTAWIALLCFTDGERRYILAPEGLQQGDKVIFSQKKAEAKEGNRMPLKYIPLGFTLHNIELQPGHGGKIVRSAGTGAMLMAREGKFSQLKMPSGEIRLISSQCSASIGQISNPHYRHIRWGKAGRIRHTGKRPSVRGKAMNPVDHPHGGGEGGSPIGLVHPKTPWGKPALGVKTRKKTKWTNKYIIKKRKTK